MRRIATCLMLIGVLALAGRGEARTVSGELVVLEGSSNSFRIVGQPGTFRAPSGIPIGTLDGRPVDVELSDDGRVLQISERNIAITPLTSGWSTVRGQLQIVDPMSRTFSMAGSPQVYSAPATLDIAPYAGQWVEARLDNDGRVTGLTLVAAPPQPAAPVASDAASCRLGDATLASGSHICTKGRTFRCDNGSWTDVGTECE